MYEPKNSIDEVKKWDLYAAIGKFNIMFEEMMDGVKECLIALVHKNYGIKLSFDEDTPEYLVDRPLKIILSEASSSHLILYLKGLLFDTVEQGFIKLDKGDEILFNDLCNKVKKANALRNNMVHSKWRMLDMSFWGNDTTFSLLSKTEKLKEKEFMYSTAPYTASELEKFNVQMEHLTHCISHLRVFITANRLNRKILEYALTQVNFEDKQANSRKAKGKKK